MRLNFARMSIEDEFELVKLVGLFFSPLSNDMRRSELDLPRNVSGTEPLSIGDFQRWLRRLNYPVDSQHQNILRVIRKLVEKGALTSGGKGRGSPPLNETYHTYIFAHKKEENGIYLSSILGLPFVQYMFKNYVVQIKGLNKKGDVVGGSGILVSQKEVLTCKHCVEILELEIETDDGKRLDINSVEKCRNIDAALITLKEEVGFDVDFLCEEPHVLDSLVTLGYPLIPGSAFKTLISGSGEVIGEVETTMYEKIFLYSTITNPGNSGGPILSSRGRLLGIVTEKLEGDFLLKKSRLKEEQSSQVNDEDKRSNCDCKRSEDEFEKRGISPYHTGISIVEIEKELKAMGKSVLHFP